MNCHHHDFVPLSPHHTTTTATTRGGGNRAMSEIVIAHDVNHPPTTSYYGVQDEMTPEQRQQRERTLAMAKAEAITSRYSHILPNNNNTNNSSSNAAADHNSNNNERRNNWVAQQQQQQPRRTSAEPGRLALSDSFRGKSNSSLASSTDDNNNNANKSDNPPPPPPPLKTEVTRELLTPKQQRPEQHVSISSSQDYHSSSSSYQQYSTPDRKMPAKKTPPQQQQRPYRRLSVQLPSQHQQRQPRRVSDSFAMTGASSQYRQRASFQANENRYSSIPTLPPRKPVSLYPDLAHQSGTRLVAAMAVEEQARLLSRLQQQKQQQENNEKMNYRATTPPIHDDYPEDNNNNNNVKSLAILEQEKLWKELSGSHQSIGTATTTAASSAASSPTSRRVLVSPQEEQARLWEQIQLQSQSQTSFSMGGSSSSWFLDGSGSTSLNNGNSYGGAKVAVSPIDEQARMLEAIQQQQQRRWPSEQTYDTTGTAAPDSFLSTVEAQERMLRALASSSTPDRSYSPPPPLAPVIDPLEEQAKRLREIQDEKDKQIVEMACKMSFAVEEPPAADVAADDEVTLEVVMELSRQEAAEAQAKAEFMDQQALQAALSQSRGELGPVDASVVDASAAPSQTQAEDVAASDLELRRSIAELACQSSDRTLEETADQPVTHLSFPTPRNRNKSRRRTWGLGFRNR